MYTYHVPLKYSAWHPIQCIVPDAQLESYRFYGLYILQTTLGASTYMWRPGF
jgi:hypothetical protein